MFRQFLLWNFFLLLFQIIDQEYITRSFSYEYPEEYNEIEGEFKSSIENSNTFENATLIGTKVTYTLENAQPSDSGIYTCQSNYTEDVNVTLHISEGTSIIMNNVNSKNVTILILFFFSQNFASPLQTKQNQYFPELLDRA